MPMMTYLSTHGINANPAFEITLIAVFVVCVVALGIVIWKIRKM